MLKKVFITAVTAVFCFVSCLSVCARMPEDISARSAVLYCPDTSEIVFEKNAEEKRSMASTTKIMTSLIVLEQNTPDRVVTVTEEAVNVEGTSAGLKKDDKIRMEDLVYCMMLESGNDAANVAAIAIAGSYEQFAVLMNSRAETAGMKNSSFETPSGLDGDSHYTTAHDMALLASEALKNEDFKRICKTESYTVHFVGSDKTVSLHNHNRLLHEYEGCIGIKTGFTKKSGRCLVSAAERNGVTLIAVTLYDPDDWSDHKKMFDTGFALYKKEEIGIEIEKYTVPVAGYGKKYVNISCSDRLVTVCNSNKELKHKIYLEKFLYAPAEVGTVVGYVEVFADGKAVKRLPLCVK